MKQALTFPELAPSTNQRPGACPRCRRPGMARHRSLTRPVVDLKVTKAQVVQYQCERCGASVTVVPPGLQPGCRHSERTKAISVVLWGLGLSLENVRAMGQQAMARQKRARKKSKVPVLGAEETQVKVSGNGVMVGFLTDPESGEIVGMEILASREGEELARGIMEAAKHFGARALVSDELES